MYVLQGHFSLQGPILHLSSRKSIWVIWKAQAFCLSALGQPTKPAWLMQPAWLEAVPTMSLGFLGLSSPSAGSSE